MIRLWSVLMFLLTVAPMAVAMVCVLQVVRKTGKTHQHQQGVFAGVVVALVMIFVRYPHQDTYTGLDVAMYRQMAMAFAQGRGFDDVDRPFEQVPDEVKPSLLYRNVEASGARQTRDCVFELVDYPQAATRPFFLPTLPLAAAGGNALGLSVDRFVPIVGAIWVICLFIAGCAIHPVLGGGAALFLVFGSLWPSWFLRGFHADAVGGALLAMAILAGHTLRPSAAGRLLLGLLLGLAVSYHPTMAVLAAPIALAFAMRSGRVRDTAALAAGGIAGVLPLVFINLWVCQPYGDFFDRAMLAGMWRAVPEIRMVLLALSVAAVAGGGVLTLSHVPTVRTRFETPRVRRAVSIACAGLCAVAALLPVVVGGPLRDGLIETVRIGWVWMVIAAAGAAALFAMRRPLAERFLLVGLCFGALVFLYIKGVEVDVGLWSYRRLCPVVFCLVSLLCVPLAEGLRAIARRCGLNISPWTLILMIVVLWFLPTSRKGVSPIEAIQDWYINSDDFGYMQNNRLTLFDYYPHSVPHQWNLQQAVFGLNEAAAKELGHAPVMAWLADEAKRRPVSVVSSYGGTSPELVEDSLHFSLSFTRNEYVNRYAPAGCLYVEPQSVVILRTYYKGTRITEANREQAVQNKGFDGSPLGLRPPWGRKVEDGVWSMEGSGIVGTLPPPGGEVAITVKARWFPPHDGWSNQVLVVTSPFEGEPLEFTIPAGGKPVVCEGVIARPVDSAPDSAFTGIYRIHAKTPYNPDEHGIRGYGDGLGAVIESIVIRARNSAETR